MPATEEKVNTHSGDHEARISGGIVQAFIHPYRNAYYLGVRYLDVFGEIVCEEKCIKRLVRDSLTNSEQTMLT
jgi:hypothetical protein